MGPVPGQPAAQETKPSSCDRPLCQPRPANLQGASKRHLPWQACKCLRVPAACPPGVCGDPWLTSPASVMPQSKAHAGCQCRRARSRHPVEHVDWSARLAHTHMWLAAREIGHKWWLSRGLTASCVQSTASRRLGVSAVAIGGSCRRHVFLRHSGGHPGDAPGLGPRLASARKSICQSQTLKLTEAESLRPPRSDCWTQLEAPPAPPPNTTRNLSRQVPAPQRWLQPCLLLPADLVQGKPAIQQQSSPPPIGPGPLLTAGAASTPLRLQPAARGSHQRSAGQGHWGRRPRPTRLRQHAL